VPTQQREAAVLDKAGGSHAEEQQQRPAAAAPSEQPAAAEQVRLDCADMVDCVLVRGSQQRVRHTQLVCCSWPLRHWLQTVVGLIGVAVLIEYMCAAPVSHMGCQLAERT
jgi:hypothetical protein